MLLEDLQPMDSEVGRSDFAATFVVGHCFVLELLENPKMRKEMNAIKILKNFNTGNRKWIRYALSNENIDRELQLSRLSSYVSYFLPLVKKGILKQLK